MELRKLPQRFTVCKVKELSDASFAGSICFIAKTDEELSLVCEEKHAPDDALEREDGWRGFRVQGTLDFSLVGILSRISSALAEAGIGIFAVSTYNTDYILVKEESFAKAEQALSAAGYTVTA